LTASAKVKPTDERLSLFHLKGSYRESGGTISQGHSDRTRRNGHQFLQKEVSSVYMKKFFTVRTTEHWTGCPEK